MVYAIFIPLFFAGIGLKIDFVKNFNLFLALLITFVSIFGKFFGAWLGATFAKLSKPNIMPVAVAHTPGGEMEIVIGILALKYNIINESIFVGIVFGALVSAVLLGPWLAHAISSRKEISILEFFHKTNVIPEIKATDRNSVLLEICYKVVEQESISDSEALYARVLNREGGMGTAMEEGIAIPHARIPLLMKPIVVFGRSSRGIEWNSPDGKPTNFVFLVLTPKENDWVQIQILGIIARVMAKEETREAIMQAESSDDLWNILEQAFSSHRVIKKNNRGKG
jgi:mannitol/fructose-specific phosphotransferase system IIA component (Ntr-type)